MSKIEHLSLITVEGATIKLEIPEDIFEEVYDDFINCMKTNSIWNVGNWLNVKVDYKGNYISNINIKHIIGFN